MMLQIFPGEKQIGQTPVNPAKTIDKNYLSKQKMFMLVKHRDEIIKAIKKSYILFISRISNGKDSKKPYRRNSRAIIKAF
jgi:hypothetical protein